MFRRSLLAPLAVVLFLALAATASAAVRVDPLHNDGGTYRVYFRDKLIGTEKFSLEPRGDSVLVLANVDEQIPTPAGDQRLEKKMSATIKTLDYDLLTYSSEHQFMGRRTLRGLNAYDTTFTAYRETETTGGGTTYARPPGRMFVIDAQVFVLFDLLLRSLHGRMIERQIPVVILAEPRDTVMDIAFRPGASETIKVQGKDRTAKRVTLSDGNSEFVAWLAPAGHMLRLDLPASGLRVERVSAALAPIGAKSGAAPAPPIPAGSFAPPKRTP